MQKSFNLIYLVSRGLCSFKPNKIDWTSLKFRTKVPQSVVSSQFEEKTERIKVTEPEIELLEKLSLVDLERT
jgi:hypothetical protein